MNRCEDLLRPGQYIAGRRLSFGTAGRAVSPALPGSAREPSLTTSASTERGAVTRCDRTGDHLRSSSD